MNRKKPVVPWRVLHLESRQTSEGNTNMKLEEIADLHNRRGNIGTVAKRCAEHGYPLLAWPEDKALLKLDDLPIINGRPNKPTTWTDFEYTVARIINSDEELREFIREGFAYAVKTVAQQFAGNARLVVEYKVETR